MRAPRIRDGDDRERERGDGSDPQRRGKLLEGSGRSEQPQRRRPERERTDGQRAQMRRGHEHGAEREEEIGHHADEARRELGRGEHVDDRHRAEREPDRTA